MLNETQKILDRLAAADRVQQKEAGGRLLLRSVKYGCAAVLAAFVLDVIFHLRAGWRLGLLLALILGGLALLVVAWRVAFVRRNRLEHTARFLETRDAALGSRLINLLQLDAQRHDPALAPLTRDLARQAVENYAADLGAVPVERLARTDEIPRQVQRAAWALGGFAVVLAIGFRITATEVARFADPFGDHPPYSFTHLEIVQPGPTGTNVLYGRGLIVKATARGHRAKDVFLTTFPAAHPEQGVTVPMFANGSAGFQQQLDNIRAERIAYVHTQDHVSESKQVRVGVVLTPQLEKMFVRIAAPAYTGLQPQEKIYESKGVQALAGSEVKFRLVSNRPLRAGWLEVTAGESAPQNVALKPAAENEVRGGFIATDSGRLRLGLVDVDGLGSVGDHESALTVTHDLPPEIRVTQPERESFVSLDFKLEAHVEASDDYGLREIRFHRGVNGVFAAPKTIKYDAIVLDARVREEIRFTELGIKAGDEISLFAEALDNAPEPHLARSQVVRLAVISVEDYNNFLREQTDLADTAAKYAELNEDLQGLIEKQKQLGAAAQKLQAQLAKTDAQKRAALAPQLDSLVAQQNELNARLNQHAERMDHFVRDNPVYDVEKDLQAALQAQAGQIRRSTSANDDASRDVAQRSSPPAGPRQLPPELLEDFKKASDQQLAQLGATHDEAEKETVRLLDEMGEMQELVKDFNLFESLYRAQQELAQQAQAYNRPGPLTREDQLALKNLAATEQQVVEALDQLQAKLRDDARAAEKNFPKAAQSGRDLADKIGTQRMKPLAVQTTIEMLAGDGEKSFLLADRLRGEMEKLFGECRGGNCPSGDELDNYLKLQRKNPGNNFAQLARSRKFGFGKGHGWAGQGEGQAGSSGYAITDGASPSVMGNEAAAKKGNAAARQAGKNGQGSGPATAGGRGEIGQADVLNGLNPVNRQSAAAASEAVSEEYRAVVENYFKAITTKKGKSDHEK
jgi:molybdopterin converting factor small subunit